MNDNSTMAYPSTENRRTQALEVSFAYVAAQEGIQHASNIVRKLGPQGLIRQLVGQTRKHPIGLDYNLSATWNLLKPERYSDPVDPRVVAAALLKVFAHHCGNKALSAQYDGLRRQYEKNIAPQLTEAVEQQAYAA